MKFGAAFNPDREVKVADLFCGAGGTSRGAVDALKLLGLRCNLTAINHWDVAIATHKKNHKGARHLCTGVDSVNPRDLFAEDELDFLWASPECTHHSTARGGKPINDQSRATAWCVVRWADCRRPPRIMLENVPEFRTWGPLMKRTVIRKIVRELAQGEEMLPDEKLVVARNPLRPRRKPRPVKVWAMREVEEWVPIKERKGEIFQAWINSFLAMGYIVEYRVLCCANYGDPTTRKRLFIQMVRMDSGLRCVWPKATHVSRKSWKTNGGLKPWVPVKDIIEWQIKGKSIFDRKTPLAQNTLKRILVGLSKQGIEPFILPQQSNPVPHGMMETLGAVVAEGSGPKLVESIVICMEHGGHADDVREPLRTITTARGGAMGIADAEAFVLPGFGERGGQAPRTHDVNEPAPAVTGSGSLKLVGLENMVVELRGTSSSHLESSSRSTKETLGAVHANGTHHALVEPAAFVVQVAHGSTGGSEASRVMAMGETAPTICGNRGDLAFIEPSAFVVPQHSSNEPKDVAETLGVVTTTSRGIGLAEPAVEEFTLPQHSGGQPRGVSEPLSTVASTGSISLLVPYVIKFYGTSSSASIGQPLDTVTAKDRFGLAEPLAEDFREIRVTVDSTVEIGGVSYPLAFVNGVHCLVCRKDGRLLLIAIRFRMLTPKELARAQGFRPDHKFTGNKTEVVKQIGNAVPYHTARALVLACVSQQEDISQFLKKARKPRERKVAA